jgi:hypothetical protein
MLNYLWLGLVLAGVLLGTWNGKLEELGPAAFDAAKNAVMLPPASAHPAFSRCSRDPSGHGVNDDEYGCKHARPQQCCHTTRPARNAGFGKDQSTSGNGKQRDVHLSRDQHKFRTAHPSHHCCDPCGSRLGAPYGNHWHGVCSHSLLNDRGYSSSEAS